MSLLSPHEQEDLKTLMFGKINKEKLEDGEQN